MNAPSADSRSSGRISLMSMLLIESFISSHSYIQTDMIITSSIEPAIIRQ
jgi:hypothetical protein